MSADDPDIMNTATAGDADPRVAEKEEEQSGLTLLLQQMSLSELREIARQRGWHVNGTSKADCVSALSSLLSDPTETARAVTEMPENLREALRAALVADDGSGITATTMAQTMTALRSASGRPIRDPAEAAHPSQDKVPGSRVGQAGAERPPSQAIKPVEAAALLIDLAWWGLMLPWRDSLHGQGRYVLPWHAQRLLPPLSGWCTPAAQAPTAQIRVRNARQFVARLYAIWENIAVEEPAVRPRAPGGRDAAGPRCGQSSSDGTSTAAGERRPVSADAPDRGAPASSGRRNSLAAARSAERRLQSLVQGWPYDPEELQTQVGTRRRAETTAQTLTVPPSPLLVEDAALATLMPLGQADNLSPSGGAGPSLAKGDGEEVEFMCRLLCELGLVSIENDHLVAQREQMVRFLRRSVADQHRAAAQAYLSLLDWSELDSLLRRDHHLTLWHKPYFAIPYDQFRSGLVRLRHLLLRFLASAGEEGWCKLAEVEAGLRELWPHFSSALQSERESWLIQAWGLAAHRDEREAETAEPPSSHDAEFDSQPGLAQNAGWSAGPGGGWHQPAEIVPADWTASQGALLRVMLEGPLYWLGFAELNYGNGLPPAASSGDLAGPAVGTEPVTGQLTAFRLRGLANWIWGRPTARFDMQGTSAVEAVTIDETSGTVALQPGSVTAQTHAFLGRIARLEEASPERFLYRLHHRAALAAFESGATLSDLLAEWKRVMPGAMPSALQQKLSQWWSQYGQVRLYDGFGLLEVQDDFTLRELEAGTSLSQHIVARLSPRLVLVREEAVDGLLREFAAKDYTPKEED